MRLDVLKASRNVVQAIQKKIEKATLLAATVYLSQWENFKLSRFL